MSWLKNLFNFSDGNTISTNLKKLLIIHTMFVIGTSMSNIFLNIFIWKVSKDINLVIDYNIYSFIALPLTFVVGGWISKRKGLRINLILGMLLYTLFYLLVFLFRYSISGHMLLVGALKGISTGFYYVSFNVLGYDFSTDKNRDYYFGLSGLVNSVTSMFAPFISGFIISSYKGNLGYEIIFVSSFILFFIGSIVTFSFPSCYAKKTYNLGSIIKLPFINDNWRRLMWSESLRGVRDVSVVAVVVNIVIFMLTNKESIVGSYSFWTSLVATAACYIGGIIINPRTRIKHLFISALFTTLAGFLFIFKIDMSTLWVFGIITSISISILNITHNSISFSVIDSTSNGRINRIEAIVTKDIFLNTGRVAALAVLYYVGSNIESLGIYTIVIGVATIPIWLLLRGVDIKKHIIHPNVEYEHKILKTNEAFYLASHSGKIH